MYFFNGNYKKFFNFINFLVSRLKLFIRDPTVEKPWFKPNTIEYQAYKPFHWFRPQYAIDFYSSLAPWNTR